MKKCLVIYNPNSGKKNVTPYLSQIEKILLKKEYEMNVVLTEYKGHAVDIVANVEDIDLIMSFGGDGTFNEVMTGNYKRKKRIILTHIPVGTTNDIGSMLGYGKDIIENVKMSLNGIVKEIDIGIINNHPFIYVAGFGKYTNISYDTSRELKKKIGHLAYIKEGIVAFFNKTKLYDINYTIDGEEYRGLFSIILISNANHIAGVKNVYKEVRLDDNKFEIVFCSIKNRKDILKSLYFLTLYGPSKVPGLYFYRGTNIKIKINNNSSNTFCIDGEKLEKNYLGEYNISILNGVSILMPKKNINKLFINKD